MPNQWIVFRYNLERPHPQMASPDLLALSDVLAQLPVLERPHGMPFLIGPDGRPDHRVNAFFASRAMRTRSALTWRKYGYCLGMWLNFLLVLGKTWDQATADDAEYFKEWRLTEEANPRPVESITFAGNVAALRSFYRWAAHEFGVSNPVAAVDDFDLRPRGARSRDIKWLDPGGFRRWRDLGLRGIDLSGREDPLWRGRNGSRDVAFVDGLYGSGLRLSEWAGVLLIELPEDDPDRSWRSWDPSFC